MAREEKTITELDLQATASVASSVMQFAIQFEPSQKWQT